MSSFQYLPKNSALNQLLALYGANTGGANPSSPTPSVTSSPGSVAAGSSPFPTPTGTTDIMNNPLIDPMFGGGFGGIDYFDENGRQGTWYENGKPRFPQPINPGPATTQPVDPNFVPGQQNPNGVQGIFSFLKNMQPGANLSGVFGSGNSPLPSSTSGPQPYAQNDIRNTVAPSYSSGPSYSSNRNVQRNYWDGNNFVIPGMGAGGSQPDWKAPTVGNPNQPTGGKGPMVSGDGTGIGSPGNPGFGFQKDPRTGDYVNMYSPAMGIAALMDLMNMYNNPPQTTPSNSGDGVIDTVANDVGGLLDSVGGAINSGVNAVTGAVNEGLGALGIGSDIGKYGKLQNTVSDLKHNSPIDFGVAENAMQTAQEGIRNLHNGEHLEQGGLGEIIIDKSKYEKGDGLPVVNPFDPNLLDAPATFQMRPEALAAKQAQDALTQQQIAINDAIKAENKSAKAFYNPPVQTEMNQNIASLANSAINGSIGSQGSALRSFNTRNPQQTRNAQERAFRSLKKRGIELPQGHGYKTPSARKAESKKSKQKLR